MDCQNFLSNTTHEFSSETVVCKIQTKVVTIGSLIIPKNWLAMNKYFFGDNRKRPQKQTNTNTIMMADYKTTLDWKSRFDFAFTFQTVF